MTSPEPTAALLHRHTLFKLAVAGAVPVSLMGCVVLWGMSRAHSSTCDIPHQRELSQEELVDVTHRFEDYRSSDTKGMTLSEVELAMLVEDRAGTPVYFELSGTSATGQVVYPSSFGGCWNVGFTGQMTVDDGAAFLLPDSFRVGDLDLSWWMAGRPIELLPEDMPSSRIARLLQQTHHAEIQAGSLWVELASPEAFRLHGR